MDGKYGSFLLSNLCSKPLRFFDEHLNIDHPISAFLLKATILAVLYLSIVNSLALRTSLTEPPANFIVCRSNPEEKE